MNKCLTLTLLCGSLTGHCAFGMQLYQMDWGHHGHLLKTTPIDNVEITNKPTLWEFLTNEEIRQKLGTTLETLQNHDNGKITLDCAWLQEFQASIEQKCAAEIKPAFDSTASREAVTIVEPETKKHIFLTRVLPTFAALGIGYYVGKECSK